MAREQIVAAGGIVLRREQPPRVAVVRLRKRDEWVLPKGRLDDGETPRDAAKREVLEETGHNVTVHEFLGTLVVDTGARSKVVHYWRMEASGEQTRPLMDDIRAVDWLPLDEAVERLSRSHEKTFLENVGPYALAGLIRRTKAKPAEEEQAAASKPAAKSAAAIKPAAPKVAAPKPVPTRKRRTPMIEPAETMPALAPVELAAAESTVGAEAAHTEPANQMPEPAPEQASAGPADVTPADVADVVEPRPTAAGATEVQATVVEPLETRGAATPVESSDVERVHAVAARIKSMTTEAASRIASTREQDEALHQATAEPDAAAEPATSEPANSEAQATAEIPDLSGQSTGEPPHRTLAQKVRGWFGRAA